MSKYDPLYTFLKATPQHLHELTLAFTQIEQTIGASLPPSAHNHRPWWENPSGLTQHSQAKSWLAAGWQVDTVNQAEQWVRFKRLNTV